MNLEYCHIYYTDYLKDKDIIKKTLHNEKHLFKLNYKDIKLILIDDKNLSLTNYEKLEFKSKIIQEAIYLNMSPSFIFFEDSFNNLAEYIFNKIPKCFIKREFFRKENKFVYFFNDGENKFSLREEKDNIVKNYCVLLSTAWSVYKNYNFGKNFIILDERYSFIEKRVSFILNSLKLNSDNLYYTY